MQIVILCHIGRTHRHTHICVYVLISDHKALVKNVKKKQIAVLTQVEILGGACSCRGGSNGMGERRRRSRGRGKSSGVEEPAQGEKRQPACVI